MQKRLQTKSSQVIFSKWTRKAYAVFSSLNKVVNIAQLSVDISTKAMMKYENLIKASGFCTRINDDDSENEEELYVLLSLECLLLSNLNTLNTEESKKRNHLYCWRTPVLLTRNRGFLFLNPLRYA